MSLFAPDTPAPTDIQDYEHKLITVFDPYKAPRNKNMILDGIEYNKYIDSLEWLKCDFEGTPGKISSDGIDIGEYKFGHAIFPLYAYEAMFPFGPGMWRRSKLHMMDEKHSVSFSTEIKIPMICRYGDTWMSITPGEIVTQRPGLRYGRGNVLVGGLGLGWFANECCKRKQVRKVTVVERDQGLVDYFGTKLKEIHGDRIEFIIGDAYEELENYEKYDSVLYDIWPSISDSEFDKEWIKFVSKIEEADKRWWGWGTARNIVEQKYYYLN